jgi:peptidoglycan/xylan/chitin deacetylase (PgdA/CDA1 family)
VQVDIDGWWAYCAAYGESASLEPDPVFAEALPRLREMFDRHAIRATLFVVGADMMVPWKRRLIAGMARDGHEIANHTHRHRLGLPGYSRAEIRAEIAEAESILADVAGARPVGFRAPGYAIDEAVFEVLEERGYRYDSSLLPTFWGGVIRAFQARGRPRGTAPKGCFGRPAYGLAPLAPYLPARRCLWRRARRAADTGGVVEVPVTTMPLVRVPFHSTWVFSLGPGLFRLGRASCAVARAPINYVFHAIDLIGDEAGAPMLPRLGIRAPLARRQHLCERILCDLAGTTRLQPTREWVARLSAPDAERVPARGRRPSAGSREPGRLR